MTEVTIRLLDEGGVQIHDSELAKISKWQSQTGSRIFIGLIDENYCESSLLDESLHQQTLYEENKNPFNNSPPG